MPTSKETLDSLRKALALVPDVAFVPTLGEYSVYSRGRLFAAVTNNELFIKASPETLCLFRDRKLYAQPGGIDMCRADADWLQDPEKLGEAVLYTLAIPTPAGRESAKKPAGSGPARGWLARLPWEKALACCAGLAALYFLLPYGALSALGINKGTKAGNFAVTGLHGEKLQLSDCGGKPVFLYIWETHSQLSIDNLPMIEALYASYKDKSVCFVPATVTSDFNSVVRGLAAAKGLKYPVYNGAAQFQPQRRSPMLYLIDHAGYIRKSYSPSSEDREKITADLDGLLRAAAVEAERD
ncbi:MAG: redoxin domain-containing protein [Elusimicrobiales bacterium]|nr:redoxin domain-containing protein [Elusimicrobiales bacterium]